MRFIGMGEALDKLEDFRAEGLASRILGFGDVVSLVKDFEQHVDQATAEADAQRMLSGQFTFDDFLRQLETVQKMGSIRDLFERMPFFADIKDQIPEGALDDRELVKIKSVILSMTHEERRNPDLLTDSRMRRIARGSGSTPQQVDEIFQRFLQARQMMGQLGQATGLLQQMDRMKAGRKPQFNPQAQSLFQGMPGFGPKQDNKPKPMLSVEDKLARRKKAKDARKARKGS